MSRLLGRFIFAGSLFIAVLSIGLFFKPGHVFALTQNLSGDVSIGCPVGCQAVTNNPTSYYQIESPNTGSPTNVRITVNYPCASNMGFKLNAVNGGGDPNYQDPSACASRVGGSATVNFSMYTGANCQWDPNHSECYAIISITSIGASSGHFSYSLNVNGSADIANGASTSPTSDPSGGNWPGGGWAQQFGLFPQNVSFNFETPCNMSRQFVYVAWAGVDYGSSYQPGHVSWQLTDNGSWVNSESDGQLDGNNPANSNGVFSYGFWAYPGHTYSWSWTGIDQGHGGNEVVFSVPFTENSFDLGQSCGPKWQLADGSSYGPTSVTPGGSVNFNFYVQNFGPSPASYYWHIQKSYGGGPGSYSDIGQSGTPSNVPANGYNPNWIGNSQVPWSATSGAANGSLFCERIVYTHAGGPSDNLSTKGSPDCISLYRPPTPVVTCGSAYVPENQSASNQPPPAGVAAPTGYSWSSSTAVTVPTYAQVTINGTTQSPNVYDLGKTEGGSGPVYDISAAGTVHSPYVATYVPTTANISVTINYYEYALLHQKARNGDYQGAIYQVNSATYNLTCYSGTANTPAGSCSLSVSGGNGPGGVITAGQGGVVVTGTIYNPNTGNNITLPPNLPDGTGLSLTSGGPHYYGAPIPVGGVSGPISWGIGINGGPNPSYQTVSAYPDYYGNGPIGPACSITFPVYAPFTLTPYAQTTLNPNLQAPTQINNNTWVVESGAAVSENVTSSLSYTSTRCGNPTISTTSNGGPFNPGSTTYLYNNYNYAPCMPRTAGDTYCSQINVPVASGGFVGPAGDIVGGTGATATSCPKVVNEPFFKIYNSSISTGSSFPNSSGHCTGGELASWNNDTGTWPSSESFGAGGQLNALAALGITGFGTNQNTPPTLNNPPTNLSLANTGVPITTDTDSPSLGGGFGSTPCYVAPSALIGSTGLPSTNINAMASNGKVSYTYNGNLDLFGGSINPGTDLGIYVNGNVYIHPGTANGITYNGANNGSWNASNIPSFVLAATGNIYIDPGVTELDGFYSAQPNSANVGGNIYTCGVNNGGGSYTYMDKDSLYTSCNNQLTVYGSFQANHVNLMRAYGSLRDETPAGGTPAVSVSANGNAYTSCTPIPPSWGTIPCANSGSSVYNLQEYGATYSFAAPAQSDYKLTLNYQNFQGNWPPPSLSPPYTFQVEVDVNGVQRGGILSLSATGTSVTDDLGPVGANPSITIKWLNNGYPPPSGNSVTGSDPGFVPGPGGPTQYDPNFEIDSLQLNSTSTPASAQIASPCSNQGATSFIPGVTCAAEVFDLSPELYLSQPSIEPPNHGTLQLHSLTSLPPIL